ncbi:hypothetical protein P12x_001783 [Tundrisphaera lichenicola]|uniref:hypothetical protein n=1 Tax=Tundrisphaera lichenicola TaxID=2029860 RepID=UPI003EBE30A9
MSTIEISSGYEAILTFCLHFQFRWMGDHWKQEIASVGGCEAIPRIWSIEGLVSDDAPIRPASPAYQILSIDQQRPDLTTARLEGRAGPHHYSGRLTFEEKADEVVINVEVIDRCTNVGKPLTATYLIESSSGHLHPDHDSSVRITWPHPDTHLVFEADPPARVEAQEAGMGTIRLKAVVEPDPSAKVQTLHYRWRWITTPGHQIWNRDV